MTAPFWAAHPATLTSPRASGFGGRWADRRWMNTPGPYYTGEADFVLMGSSCAPELVGIDHEGVDVIFRQPTCLADVQAIETAAASDPFDGYGRDGNAHWTLAGIREWWRRRDEIVRHVESYMLGVASWRHEEERPLLQRVWASWRRFLDEEAASYLRRYAHFLEHGAWPELSAPLPDL